MHKANLITIITTGYYFGTVKETVSHRLLNCSMINIQCDAVLFSSDGKTRTHPFTCGPSAAAFSSATQNGK